MSNSLLEPFNFDAVYQYMNFSPQKPLKLGLEIEFFAVEPSTGRKASFDGPHGIESVLHSIRQDNESNWLASTENNRLLGLQALNEGFTITLEPGAAIEYSSPLVNNISELTQNMQLAIGKILAATQVHGLILIASANAPFESQFPPYLLPRNRYQIMRNHFQSQGKPSDLAWRMMTQTLSIQTSVDYTTIQDLELKLPLMVKLAPFFTAVFANSPIEDSQTSPYLSSRAHIWTKTDPHRCGFITPALSNHFSLEAYIDWTLKVPMIFRIKNGVYTPMNGATFKSVLANGFDDGSSATLGDWVNHITGIFTDVRLKNFIEIRGIDGQTLESIPTVPIFWSTLAYNTDALLAIKDILKPIKPDAFVHINQQVPKLALETPVSRYKLKDIAYEIVQIAQTALKQEIKRTQAPPAAMSYLENLATNIKNSITPAHLLKAKWDKSQQSKSEIIQYCRVTHETLCDLKKLSAKSSA